MTFNNRKIQNIDITLKHVVVFLLFLFLFFAYIISFSMFIAYLCERYPQIDAFAQVHPVVFFDLFLVLLVFYGIFLVYLIQFLAILWGSSPSYQNIYRDLKKFIKWFLFVLLIISTFNYLDHKFPQVRHLEDTSGVSIIIASVILTTVIIVASIRNFKDRKHYRCPKCKTKYKEGNMEIGPGKIISTFQCKKCGYENKITEPFVFKKFERMFGNAVDSGNFTAEQIRELKEMSEKYDENLNNQE